MGRQKKLIESNEQSSTALVKSQNAIALELPNLSVSESEQMVLDKAAGQITVINSRLAVLDREIERINEEMRKDELRSKLKTLKKEKKAFLLLNRDATNRYNGVLEVVLRDVPGKNISEKIDNINLLTA